MSRNYSAEPAPAAPSSSGRPSSSDGRQQSVSGLLQQLVEACAQHKHNHDEESNSDKTSKKNKAERPDWCHTQLESLARVLPKMEASIDVRDTHRDEYYHCDHGIAMGSGSKKDVFTLDGEGDVGTLCQLYRAIARGTFCQHAASYLFVGRSNSSRDSTSNDEDLVVATDYDIAKGILPRIAKLLHYLAMDPVRVAISPLKKTLNNKHSTLGDSVRMHYQEEDIGSTIVALLNLLQDDQLRFLAVRDLINLSNDLSTIDESKALFEPPSDEEGGDGTHQTKNSDNIRVHVFTEVARYLQRKSNKNADSESELDCVVSVPSQRSLLALQVGVWTAVQHFVPLLIGGDEQSSSDSVTCWGNKVELMKLLMSSSRSTSLVLPRPSSHEPYFLGWSYSPSDAMIHSLLELRTKIALVGLFTDIAAFDRSLGTRSASSVVGTARLTASSNLALLSIEAAQFHLVWGQSVSSEAFVDDNYKEAANTLSPFSRNMERRLVLMCSWAISNFISSTVLFPDKTTISRDAIWSQCFPHFIDFIPVVTDSSDKYHLENEPLRRIILRSIHMILLSGNEPEPKWSTPQVVSYTNNTSSMTSQSSAQHLIGHFTNCCIAKGYFLNLFDLAKDSSESISGPAISILAYVLESISSQMNMKNVVEDACSGALGVFKTNDLGSSSEMSDRSVALARLGNKRRKLETSPDDKEGVSESGSIQSTLINWITSTLISAQDIKARLVEGNKNDSPLGGGPEVMSLFCESDVCYLRGVAGCLRTLLSIRSHVDVGVSHESTGGVISQLFQCVKSVSEVLARQKTEDGKLIRLESDLLYSVLSLLVGVGLHACRLKGRLSEENRAARESLSHCALATVAIIGNDQVIEHGNDPPRVAATERANFCESRCYCLASMFGSVKAPASDTCLCRLTGESNRRLSSECGAFLFDATLPLQSR